MRLPLQAGIDIRVELKSGTEDDVYLNRLRAALERAALVLPRPDLVRGCVGVGVGRERVWLCVGV